MTTSNRLLHISTFLQPEQAAGDSPQAKQADQSLKAASSFRLTSAQPREGWHTHTHTYLLTTLVSALHMDQSQAAHHVGVDERHRQNAPSAVKTRLHRRGLEPAPPLMAANAKHPEEKSDSVTCTQMSALSQQRRIVAGLCARRCVQSLQERRRRRQWSDTETNPGGAHTRPRERDQKARKETCLLPYLAVFSPFSLLRSSLPPVTSRSPSLQQREQRACRGRPGETEIGGRRERRRGEGGRERQCLNTGKSRNHKKYIPPISWWRREYCTCSRWGCWWRGGGLCVKGGRQLSIWICEFSISHPTGMFLCLSWF